MTQKIGIIGGSGLYKLDIFKDFDFSTIIDHKESDTKEAIAQKSLEAKVKFIESQTNVYGRPSAPIRKCTMEGVDAELYFLARHGEHHQLTPSEVPYQANILALKGIGVDWIISVSAVGSLKEDIPPTHFVVIDQFIDRTKGRPSTFFHNGIVAHMPFGDPICETLRRYILTSAREVTEKVHDGGTYVCMEGPAFSTRAESRLYQQWGASVIGMTNLPEAKLAREAEISYATLAMSTDYDCWRTDESNVDVASIEEVIRQNTQTAQEILTKIIPKIANHSGEPPQKGALKNTFLTKQAHWPPKRIYDLKSILGPYLKKNNKPKDDDKQ